ncbi:glycosyltransferase [Paenibacillus xerothermodurans]|uniref:Glycosyltransferase family 4 protein n=1 Tax=Paenibacillus xerothermodurans TaxID=1977292 RepID=A0A2W1NCN7_PAEXE|nr:glycosyltransferase [Paenibacillus xerothermodurans]PZE20821.1 glycosyltransferase family 4 protein [Paenibacillus xerothermodurans]
MKVALVHDYLNQYGGAERVLECFMDLFPEAPVYTIISDLSKMPERFRQAKIHNSFVQNIPFSRTQYKKMLGLFPLAVEQFDLRGYDLILSSSSAFAKGILTNPSQLHICYCHTPMRYVWDLYHQYMEEISNPLFKKVLPFILHRIRNWDQISSHRVDHYISNSHNVSRRISKYYKRESHVIHPPVAVDRFQPTDQEEDYFLIVSRLIPYKRIDLVIEVFNRLKLPLVIIGDGYDRDRLKKLAGPTVTMLGYQSDETITEYYAKCKAFILAGEEDFGITPLEAQANGKPVIAFGKGGALETVVEGKTGVFFHEHSIASLAEAVEHFHTLYFDPQFIRRHADQFNERRFKQQISNFIIAALDQKGDTVKQKEYSYV